MLVQICLFCLEHSDRALHFLVFDLLRLVTVLHVVLSIEHVLGESVPNLRCFLSKVVLQVSLLRTEIANLTLVKVEFFSQCFACLFKPVDFALESSIVYIV